MTKEGPVISVDRARRVLLNGGAVLGAVVLGALLVGAALGLRPVVVTSGSMAPALPTGSLLVDRATPVTEVRVGDVVTMPTGSGSWVTHRVVQVDRDRTGTTLRLRGDANDQPDAGTHRVASGGEVERVVGHVPVLGRVLAALRSPVGLLVLGAMTAAVLPVMWRGAGPRGPGGGDGRGGAPGVVGGSHRSTARGGRRRAGAGSLASVVAAALALAVVGAAPSNATWTDTVAVSGTTLTAYSVPKPANITCTVTGGALAMKTATIVWDEVSTPHALTYSATIVETGQSMTVTDNGSTRQTQFSAGLLSTVLNQTYTVQITAGLPAPGVTWTRTSQQPVTIALLGLGLTCGTPS